MPQYRVGFLLTYRVRADSDTDATRKVMNALAAQLPNVNFDLRTSDKSASQLIAGATTFDVQLVASGVITAADLASSLGAVSPPATNLVSSVQFGSVDTRGAGLF